MKNLLSMKTDSLCQDKLLGYRSSLGNKPAGVNAVWHACSRGIFAVPDHFMRSADFKCAVDGFYYLAVAVKNL